MQVAEDTDRPQTKQRTSAEPLLPRRTGTIPVTVRLDPPRYDRLKRLVLRLSTTGQSIMQTALDRSLPSLERERTPQAETPGQSTFFPGIPPDESRPRSKQESFAFVRPEPTIAMTYRASVPMHRWLHRRSHETGQTIQEIINDALKIARGEG